RLTRRRPVWRLRARGGPAGGAGGAGRAPRRYGGRRRAADAARRAGTIRRGHAAHAAGPLCGGVGSVSRRRRLARWRRLRAARPGLIRAAELLAGVLRDFPEQSRARDVADALGDADMLLGRYAQANGDYERAMELARPDAADADLQLASLREKVAEANRALRRQWFDRIAKALLAAIVLGLAYTKPWRHRASTT